MEVSVQRQALAAFYPCEITPGTHLTGGWMGVKNRSGQRLEEKSFASSEHRTSVVQSVVRHYTNWAAPAPVGTLSVSLSWIMYGAGTNS
jgi:hypothetical protein